MHRGVSSITSRCKCNCIKVYFHFAHGQKWFCPWAICILMLVKRKLGHAITLFRKMLVSIPVFFVNLQQNNHFYVKRYNAIIGIAINNRVLL